MYYMKMEYLVKKHQSNSPSHPQTKEELIKSIVNLLNQGINDLNKIETSSITDMSWLFNEVEKQVHVGAIDISKWDVSDLVDISYMFANCPDVEVDLTSWNITSVKYKTGIFVGCKKLHKIFANAMFF